MQRNTSIFSEQSTDSTWSSFKASNAKEAIHQLSQLLQMNFKEYTIEGQLKTKVDFFSNTVLRRDSVA